MDRFGHVGRAYHGLRAAPARGAAAALPRTSTSGCSPRFAWIDTLFALPEACLYAGIIDLLEAAGTHGRLRQALRRHPRGIDTVHRDDSLKSEMRKDLGRYIFQDPELGPALHKLRSGGKKLFLLTNSLWDYTDAVMRYLLDGVVAEYPSLAQLLRRRGRRRAQARLLHRARPFLEVDARPGAARVLGEADGRSSAARSTRAATCPVRADDRLRRGEGPLRRRPHLRRHPAQSKKASLWRTCMVVQELEDEIRYTERARGRDRAAGRGGAASARALDDEMNAAQGPAQRARAQAGAGGAEADARAQLEEERQAGEGGAGEAPRRAYARHTRSPTLLEATSRRASTRYWGLLFKEGNENSRFGEQVEQYACLYTSRVSNFLYYSPMQYFRSPRDRCRTSRPARRPGSCPRWGARGRPRAHAAAEGPATLERRTARCAAARPRLQAPASASCLRKTSG